MLTNVLVKEEGSQKKQNLHWNKHYLYFLKVNYTSINIYLPYLVV
jgi:hypothetical protein